MKVISSAVFVCTLFFGAVMPGAMACGTADDITLRKVGGENSLDFSIYYGKIKISLNFRHAYTDINRKF